MAFGLDHKKTMRRRLGKMIAITNGKIVTVTGETYENGTVLVEKGKITAVGANVASTPIPISPTLTNPTPCRPCARMATR